MRRLDRLTLLFGVMLVCARIAPAQDNVPDIDPAAMEALARAMQPQLFEMLDRQSAVKSLVREGRWDEAAAAYTQLWVDTTWDKAPDMQGVRRSFWLRDMREIAENGLQARAMFETLRTDAAAAMAGDPTNSARVEDWVTLCFVLHDDAALLAWFDEVKRDDDFDRHRGGYGNHLEELLCRNHRWTDLSLMFPDPELAIQFYASYRRMIPPEPDDEPARAEWLAYREQTAHGLREYAGMVYVAMLSDERNRESLAVMKAACELDDSALMLVTLVESALSAEEPRPEHLEWLKIAAEKGVVTEALAERVEQALSAPPQR